MRFHTIAIQNLSSLYGDHRVDLEGALGSAGLFLIHGPTGAGKSTILDAICLALYGRTPRLDDKTVKGAAEVEGGANPSDPKHLLSRGAGAGASEVELSLMEPDGSVSRYKARWEVRRARGKADGAFQAVKRGLWRWREGSGSGSWEVLVFSEKKNEVAEVFERALQGLSFEDFQRTTMLAQFAFREFLEAKEGERAAILERMTGSERFREIGRRAAMARKEADDKAKLIEAKLAGVVLLSPEEEADKRSRLSVCREELVAIGERAGLLEKHRAYRVGWRERRDQVREAERAVLDATSAQVAEAERLEALARDLEVATARQALQALGERREALARREEGLEATRALVEAREAEAVNAAELKVWTWAERQRCAQAMTEMEPALLAAEAAWRALADAEKAASQAVVERQRRAEAVNVSQERKAKAEAGFKTACEELEVVDALLRRETAGGDVVTAAVFAEGELARRKKDKQELAKKETALGSARGRRDAAALELEASQASHEAAVRALAGAEAEAKARSAAVEALAGGAEPEQVSRRFLDEALGREARRRALKALGDQVAEASGVAKRREELRAAIEAVLAKLSELRAQVATGEAAIAALEERVASEAADVEYFGNVMHVVTERGLLKEGQPCPLCGSREHPYVSEPDKAPNIAGTRARLDAAIQKKEDTEGELVEARRALNRLEKEVVKLESEREAKATQAKEAGERAEALTARIGRAATELGLGEGGVGWEAALAALDLDDERARARDGAWQAATRAEREARDALEAARGVRDRVEAARRDKEQELAGLRAQVEAEEGARAEAEARLRELERGILERLAAVGIVESTVESAVAVAVERRKRIQEAMADKERLTAKVSQAESERSGAAERATVAVLELEGAERVEGAARASLDAAREAVAGHFEGRDPAGLRKALVDALTAATATDERAGKALEEARVALEAARGRKDSAEEELARAHAERDAAETAFAAACRECGLAEGDEVEVARRSLPDAERVELMALRERLTGEVGRAEAVLSAAREALVKHEGSRPGEALELGEEAREDDDELAQIGHALAALAEQRSVLEQERGALQAALNEAEARRVQHAALADEARSAREDAGHWGLLADLIGTGEGEAFVRLVQAIQLGAVIDRANARLARFMARYRLEQLFEVVAGTKSKAAEVEPGAVERRPRLDFVVRDELNQGAPRTIKSLSGGESFIVSLALALGLADMRSAKLRIETLLIDEGFGSLDAQTLGTVLSALSALQAASGVQIGLISHVESMREAIPAQIAVIPRGQGRSEVKVMS